MKQQHKLTLSERLERRRKRHQRRSKLYRSLYTVAAFAVILVGILMIALPGPGVAGIALGLSMLALEFEWAERLLMRVLKRFEAAQAKSKASPRAQLIWGITFFVIGTTAGILGYLYKDELWMLIGR